jgi:hypothetical protein
VAEGVVADLWSFAASLLLHVVHQVVRTRGWFNIIRAADSDCHELRARDVTLAYLAGRPQRCRACARRRSRQALQHTLSRCLA